MAGPIQYAVTVDGVRIAFSASGTGRPLVYMPPIPFRHVEREWHLPEDRRWLARLERRVRLVRYDPRGLGLSVRGVKSFDLDALVRDLEAVVAAAAGDEVALFACVNTAPIAVAYALAHPGRVSHLILWCPVARMADSIAPQIGTLLELAEKDWELFTETAAHVMVGWSKGEEARRYADYLRACVTPDVARAFVETLRSVDVTERLQEVVRRPSSSTAGTSVRCRSRSRRSALRRGVARGASRSRRSVGGAPRRRGAPERSADVDASRSTSGNGRARSPGGRRSSSCDLARARRRPIRFRRARDDPPLRERQGCPLSPAKQARPDASGGGRRRRRRPPTGLARRRAGA